MAAGFGERPGIVPSDFVLRAEAWETSGMPIQARAAFGQGHQMS